MISWLENLHVLANLFLSFHQTFLVIRRQFPTTFHIVWSIFASLQIFSLIHCYLSTTPSPIFSWAYFNTPAILFKRSDSVTVLWLGATLTRINKRKQSLKKEKIKQKTYLQSNCRRLQLDNNCLYSMFPCSVPTIFSYKPHTQTFLTFQFKWAPEEQLFLNNNSAFRDRYSTKFWIIWINSNV